MTTYTTRTRTRTIERDGGFFSPNKSRRIGAAVQFQYISVASSNPGLGRRVIQGEAKQIAPRDCSARKVSGTCVIFFVGSGPGATRPL